LTLTGKGSSIAASHLEGNAKPVASFERRQRGQRFAGGGGAGCAARKRGRPFWELGILRRKRLISAIQSQPIAPAEANQAEVPASRAAVGEREPDSSPSRRTQPLIHRIVTHMVELRKLTWELINCFPDPSEKSVLQTKRLFERRLVLRRFWGYRIVPNSTNFCQKRAGKGREEPKNGGFSRLVLLKRVKSGGSCQALIGGGRDVWPAPPEA
jgi:hypothetical protein